MSGATKGEDRTRLDGFELEVFKLVREHATSAQWREWLRAPLEHAAANGHEDLFARLMGAGADGSAHWRGCNGRTLLGAAVHGESEEMVKALLKAGGRDEVDVKFGVKQESALHVAVAQGAERSSKALLLAGADPNLLNGDMESPLHIAAAAGHHGLVTVLLLQGASPRAKAPFEEQSPLHMAASIGCALCVSALVFGGADKDSCNVTGETPISLAANNNRVAVVTELLAADADVGIRDDENWSPLEKAAKEGHVGVLRELLRHGDSVEARDTDGCTALHYATVYDKEDATRVLLEAGADIEAKATDQGSTPLLFAVDGRTRSSGAICALLEGGANVNARRTNGITPLHAACRCASLGRVELLLRWGADETLVNQDGDTAADIVSKCEEGEPYAGGKAVYRHIRRMLARAPADRSWRRRGWLVLARSCPSKVQLAQGAAGGCAVCPAKIAKTSCGGGDRSGDGTADLMDLVGRVVGLDAEGVFRLVVSFL